MLLAVLFFLPKTTQAQMVPLYSFNTTTGNTYTSLPAGNSIATATGGLYYAEGATTLFHQKITNYPLPFTFYFDNRSFNSINIHCSGYVSFGNDTSVTSSIPLSTSGIDMGGIAGLAVPFSGSLTGLFTTQASIAAGSNIITNVVNTAYCIVGAPVTGNGIPDGTTIQSFTTSTITLSAPATMTLSAANFSWPRGSVRVAIQGTAPNRTFVIEYNNMSIYVSSGGSNLTMNTSINYQILLKEAGGVPANQTIEFLYGNLYRNYLSATVQVGLRGRNNTEFKNLTGGWDYPSSGYANTNTQSWTTGTPASGLKYTFSPLPACLPPVGSPSALTLFPGATAVKGSFLHASPQPNAYLAVRSSAPLSALPQNLHWYESGDTLGNGIVVSVGSDSTFLDLGLTGNTTYYYSVFAINNVCSGVQYNMQGTTSSTTTGQPKSYTWNGNSPNSYFYWTDPANWTPARNVNDPTDTLFFNDGGNYSINNVKGETVARIQVSNGTQLEVWGRYGYNDTIYITDSFLLDTGTTYSLGNLGSGMTALAFKNLGQQPVALINGDLKVGKYFPANGQTIVNGNIYIGNSNNILGSTASNLQFNAGSSCILTAAVSSPPANYHPASTIKISAAGAVASNFATRKIGNLLIDFPTGTGNYVTLNTSIDTIKGSITVNNTGTTGSAYLRSSTTVDTVVIEGNLNHNAGILRLSGGRDRFILNGNATLNGGTLDLNFSSSSSDTTMFHLRGGLIKALNYTIMESAGGNGKLLFTGSSLQQIILSGSINDTIYYVLNNPVGVALTGTLNIYQGSTLMISDGSFSGTGNITWSTTNTGLIYNKKANQTATNFEFGTTTMPNLTVDIGTGNVLTVPFSRTISGTLTMASGDMDISTNTLTLGTSGTVTGTLTWTSGNIRVSSGALKRWFPTSGLPTSASTSIGFFPLASGKDIRHLNIYFNSATALSVAGTITVNHNASSGLTTGLSITDGVTTINRRTNAFWTVSVANSLSASGTFSLKATMGGYQFYSSNPSGLRLMRSSSIAGNHVTGSGITPNYSVTRTGISQSILLSDSWYVGGVNADMDLYNVATSSGNWNNSPIWSLGSVPTATQPALIETGVSVNLAGNDVCKSLIVKEGSVLNGASDSVIVNELLYNAGTMNIAGGVIKVGPDNGGNKLLTNYGTLHLDSGTVNVNGKLSLESGSNFTQNGGNINIDGNASDVVTNSIASDFLLAIHTSNVNLNAGRITIADPPALGNSSNAVYYNYNLANDVVASPTHTFRFGNGISLDSGSKTYNISVYGSYGVLRFGNVEINGVGASRKSVIASNYFIVAGNLLVSGNSELRTSNFYSMHLGGNLTVNAPAILTSLSSTYFALDSMYWTSVSPSNHQVVSGTGTFRNAVTNPTGNFTTLYNYNTNGVTLNIGGDVTYTGELNFNGGKYYLGNNTLIQGTGGSINSFYNYASRYNGWVVGKFRATNTVGSINMNFPIGDSVRFAPLNIYGDVGAVTTAGAITAYTVKNDHPAIGGSALIPLKSINRYFALEGANGIAFANNALTLTAKWEMADRDSGVNNSYLSVGRLSGGVWTYPQVQNADDTSIQILNLGQNILSVFQPGQTAPPCVGQPVAGTIQSSLNTICPGVNYTLNLTGYSDGYSGLSLQWQIKQGVSNSWTSIPGATSFTYTTNQTQITQYRVINSCSGSGMSDTSSPFIMNSSTAPAIVQQPANAVTCSGNNVQISAQANGLPTPTVQWQINSGSGWSNIAGATNNLLAFTAVLSDNGTQYRAVYTNSCGVVVSNAATLQVNQPPTISINSASNGVSCPGATVSFNVNAINTGSNTTYQWLKNGLPISGATTSVYTSSQLQDGDSICCAMTTNTCGLNETINSNVITQTITNLVATISPSGAQTVCSGQSIILQSDSTIGYTYQWYANGSAIAGATNDNYIANTSGNYSLKLTNSSGCFATSVPVAITVKSMPSTIKIKALTTTIVCQPSTIPFIIDPTTGDVSGFSYQWNNSGTPISGETNSTYNADMSGSISLTVSGGPNCMKISAGKPITVKQKPVAYFSPSGPTTICSGQSVTFNAPYISGYSYTWLKNGVSSGIGNSKVIKSSGIYTVVAKLDGCTDTASDAVEVVVNPLPLASVIAMSPTTFCAGDSCTIVANPNNATSYQWVVNNLVDTITNLPYITTGVSASYKVIVTDTNGCTSKTSATNVKTKVNLVPIASITAVSSTTIPANGNVKLKATPASSATWQWFNNGVAISGATANFYIATTSGTYTVAVSKYGCTGMSAGMTVIQTGMKAEEGVTAADFNADATSYTLYAYPNPVQGQLNISLTGIDEIDGELHVVDYYGRLIQSFTMKTATLSIDMSSYVPGLYLIRFKDKFGRAGTIRINKS